MSELISRTTAAGLAGVSSDTLARWHKRPESDFPQPVAWTSNRKFYSKAAVLAWLQARTRTPRRPQRQSDVHA